MLCLSSSVQYEELFVRIGLLICLISLAACTHSPAVGKGQLMNNHDKYSLLTTSGFEASRQFVDTEYGRIAYVETGHGAPAVFLHGFPLNSFHWRYQLTELADIRRCIAIDLMGLGHSEISVDQDLSFGAQADMVLATLDALGISSFDLVGNDTGGGIAQLLASKAPHRLRSLVLTNADTHDNYPPQALKTVHDAAVSGVLDDLFVSFLDDPELARTGLGAVVFEDPAYLTDDLLRAYLGPITGTPVRREHINRYISSQINAEMVAIESKLRRLKVATLILWADSDPFFGIQWAYWLRDVIPGASKVVEFEGAKLFFTEERAADVSDHIRSHWASSERE